MPPLKLPLLPMVPTKPPRAAGQSYEDRLRALEQYVDRHNEWAISLTRSIMAWSKQLNDLFNIGSVKRLEE